MTKIVMETVGSVIKWWKKKQRIYQLVADYHELRNQIFDSNMENMIPLEYLANDIKEMERTRQELFELTGDEQYATQEQRDWLDW